MAEIANAELSLESFRRSGNFSADGHSRTIDGYLRYNMNRCAESDQKIRIQADVRGWRGLMH